MITLLPIQHVNLALSLRLALVLHQQLLPPCDDAFFLPWGYVFSFVCAPRYVFFLLCNLQLATAERGTHALNKRFLRR